MTGATFIVDDLHLKRRYGFVNYGALVPQLEKLGGALTVAFIPYNRHRSDSRTIRLLRGNSSRFSIAVHGCDHTADEFASRDEPWLEGTAACAMERMAVHEARTGLPFDDVMVFPQGRFSIEAIHALKATGFSAAANTSQWPIDGGASPLTLRDLLDVAVARFDGFPIFVRHYPGDPFDFAFDAFFQKPVLAVEHHGFFRHGYDPFARVLAELSSITTRLEWKPLGENLRSTCVIRQTGPERFDLRQFTPVFHFRNTSSMGMSLSVTKPEPDDTVEAVLVGDENVPFEVRSGLLHYVADVKPGEQLRACVKYRQSPRQARRPSWRYRVKVSLRRTLSEVRDNQIARSERALAFAEKVKRRINRADSASQPAQCREDRRRP